MKYLYKISGCLLVAISALTLGSCVIERGGYYPYDDRDREESVVLSGQWYGDFGMYYMIQDRWGKWMRFDSYDTNIVFYPDYGYTNRGTGKQVDYYEYGPYAYQYYYFYWTIRNGVIYLDYPYDPGLNTAIYDYYMDYNYFKGRFGNSNSTFCLRKLVDYYDWDRFRGDYIYGASDCYNDYFDVGYGASYAKTRAADSTMVEIRHGNRFAESE